MKGKGQGSENNALKIKSKKTVGRIALVLALALCQGCTWFTRTVYVPHGQAVRLRQEVKDVKVWVKTKEGEIVPGEMDLPEGWFCLPDPGEEKEDGQ